MTRDEHREKCIEAMRKTISLQADLQGLPPFREDIIAAAALDALHGVARVVPVDDRTDLSWISRYSQMSAATDLTNPPEGKP